MFGNLKIGVRLAIGFALTLALLIVVAVLGVTRINALSTQVNTLVKDQYPKTVAANDMVGSINLIARRLRNAYIFPAAEAQKELEAIPEQLDSPALLDSLVAMAVGCLRPVESGSLPESGTRKSSE